jgi:hypothetical protein
MIKFWPYKETGRAPTARVAKVGGIYRQDTGLIRVTLIDDDKGVPTARVHLLWEPWEWLDSQTMVDFAVYQFKRGGFTDGGPRTH